MRPLSLPILLSSLLLALATGCEDKGAGAEDSGDDGSTPGDTGYDNDADDDTILDIHEGSGDFDGDGTPDYLDEDSDDDGIPDSIEAGDDDPETFPVDTDEDGVPDVHDDDSDNNGISDTDEAGLDPTNPVDTDNDGDPDFRDDDNDGDAITDSWEMDFDPLNPADTDRDGVLDYMDVDSDNDTLCDKWEGGTTTYRAEPIDTDEDGTYDYRDTDSDDDGFSDTAEAGTTDCQEPSDVDGDGSYNSQALDSDGDGLSDVDEVELYNTDPYVRDTDGDGQSDGAEIYAETDPRDPSDSIEGIYVEIDERTSVEHTFPFELSVQYGDIVFLLDTTCSMASTLQGAASRFANVVRELEGTFENLSFGVGTFDDYNYGGYGSGSDKPFILRQQITEDSGEVQSVLNTLGIHNGADTPESDMEALWQAITGIGYDQACDGIYTSSTDVPPFVQDSSDAFHGTHSGTYNDAVPGTGENGGMGFHDFGLPIIFYATDYYMRDPASSNSLLQATPGGCPQDADSDLVAVALQEIGGYVVGVDVGPNGPENEISPYQAMEELAYATNSVADLNGDGTPEPLVFSVDQGGSDFEQLFEDSVITAVEQLVDQLQYEEVRLEVVGDDWGLVESIEPEFYEDVDPDEVKVLEFTLNFVATVAATEDDQLFRMTLNVIGNGTLLLDSYDIIVLIPGTSF